MSWGLWIMIVGVLFNLLLAGLFWRERSRHASNTVMSLLIVAATVVGACVWFWSP